MRQTIPSIPWLLVLRSLIIAIVIIARAVNDWKQHALNKAKEQYLFDERLENKYDEWKYREQLEDSYHEHY